MSPWGTPLENNRFALLSSSPQAKRKKNNIQVTKDELFPALPTTTKESPKYLVVSSTDANKPMNKFSCFAVHKALKNISSDIIKITELRDGNLLLLVKNGTIAKKFTTTKQLFGICNVKIELHKNLNTSKGTVYAPCLNEVADSEIIENLKEQGVVDIYKFRKIVNGQATPSGVVLLTFDHYYLPEKIDVSWYTTKVRPYYPNPMRCKNCQSLGHTKKRCNKPPACDTCALPPHNPQPCTRTHCVNCSADHSSSSKLCPKFIQMKCILTIQTDNKCTFREAVNIHKAQIPPTFNSSSASFASIANKSANQKSVNIKQNTQIEAQNSPSTLPTLNTITKNMNNKAKEIKTTSINTKNNTQPLPKTTTVDDSFSLPIDHASTTSIDFPTTIPPTSSLLPHLTNPPATSLATDIQHIE